MAVSSEDLQRICRRAASAWSIADIEHSAMQEVYRWTWPERYHEMVAGAAHAGASAHGADRARFGHLFDPTGAQALADGAGQVAEAIHPWDQPWIRFAARQDMGEDLAEEAARFGDGLTRISLSKLTRSNFHTEATASHRDFLIGTGFLSLEIDSRDRRRVYASSIPAYRIAPECDSGGRWTGFFRKYSPRARDLDDVFLDAEWSEETRGLMRTQPEAHVQIEVALVWDRRSLGWHEVVYESARKHVAREQRYRVSPIIAYRAARTGGRPWACGPATMALPDIKVVNKTVEMILRNAAFAVAGMWTAEDDGVLNPATIKLVPGAIIPKAAGSSGLTPLQMPGRFDVSNMVLEDLRSSIRRALYVTRVEERQMTAEEYRGRIQQQLRDMRGMYGQLRSEFVVPVAMRTIDLAIEVGDLEDNAWDDLLSVEMIGPLAQDARMADVERLQTSFAVISSMTGPELAMAALNAHEMVPWVARQMHVQREMFKSREDLQEFGAQIMQLAGQSMAAQMAGGAAGGGGDVPMAA